MSEIGEALGTATEGGLFARVVGGRFGKSRPPTKTDGEAMAEDSCLNCGTELAGEHCHACGQKVHIHRTITAIFHDLIHGVLHLDGKLWRTLPLLALKPGQITRRYINGERAKFVSPMAMFLFSVFAMFAVFQMVGLTAPSDITGNAREEVARLVANESERVSERIGTIDEELLQPDLSQDDRASLERERALLGEDLELLDSDGFGIAQWLNANGTNAIENLRTEGEAEIADARQRLETMPEGSQERADLVAEIELAEQGLRNLQRLEDTGIKVVPVEEDGDTSFRLEKTGAPFIDSALEKWRQNPSLMLYKLQANGYKFSWLLIPLSIPFVWLMFAWRREFKAYDHAIFVTYSLAFMSLLFIALSVLGTIGVPIALVLLAGFFIPPIHIYKHLRGTYALSRFSAVWRLLALSAFIWVVIILFLQLLLVLGAF